VNELPPSDPFAARDLAGILASDEQLLWAGRPDERRFARTDGRLIALGVFWTVVAGAAFVGFALTFLSDDYAGVARGVRVALLALGAAPFAAVSVYCLGGHVALRHHARVRTAYAVTATRVLALRPSLGGLAGPRTLRALPLARVAEPLLDAARHDTASIELHDAQHVHPPVRFDAVRGAAAVAALVRVRRGAGA